MIHRLQRGDVPAKPHTVFDPDGRIAFEHCYTREGFEGIFTILYHRSPPHWVETDEDLGKHPGWAEPVTSGSLKRRHYETPSMDEGGEPFLGRKLLMSNDDFGVWMAHPDTDDAQLVVNGDADELVFVERGSGRLETVLGVVTFAPRDYVFIPRGIPHRWRLDGPASLLIMEGKPYIGVPKQYRAPAGQLSMYAPYTHRDFKEPEWEGAGPAALDPPRRVLVKRNDAITACAMSDNPFDVHGWDGQVWPFAFPITAFQPKTGLVHLPPTIHTTFAGRGFVVCSFVPRMVDFHERAIPCPYVHSSPDCDEVLFYVDGDFTSRKGVGKGSISLHPAGVMHGPHPGRYEASVGTRRTEELAVMADTFKPLIPTRHAVAIEDHDYNTSWVETDGR